MSVKKEYPDRYGWWRNELASLGIVVMKRNELNDLRELRDLTENIKQTFFQRYKSRCNDGFIDAILI
jgi:hypothetical protein